MAKKQVNWREHFKGYKISLEFVPCDEAFEEEIKMQNIKNIVSQVYKAPRAIKDAESK